MRILVISNLFPPTTLGGYEIACAEACKQFSQLGHEVRVICGWSPETFTSEPDLDVRRVLDLDWYYFSDHGIAGVFVESHHRARCSNFGNTFRIALEISEFGPDVVYVWNLMGLGALGILDFLNGSGTPWAIHLMDRTPVEITQDVPPAVLGLYAAQGDGLYSEALVFAMSENLLTEIRSISGINIPQSQIIPGWVNANLISRRESYWSGGVIKLLSAGVISENKGIGLIVRATRALMDQGIEVSVDHFGPGSADSFLSLAHALGVEDRIKFLGPVPHGELLSRYGEYDAFLFPTWEREPFGLVAIEAAASGTPPILTRQCGAAEWLIEDLHCLKIERTVEGIVRAVTKIFNGQIDISSMGLAAQSFALRALDIATWIPEIDRSFQDFLSACKSPHLDFEQSLKLSFLKHRLSRDLWLETLTLN